MRKKELEARIRQSGRTRWWLLYAFLLLLLATVKGFLEKQDYFFMTGFGAIMILNLINGVNTNIRIYRMQAEAKNGNIWA